jgi:hypothetical protein
VTELAGRAARVAAEAARRYARWDEARFAAFRDGPAAALARAVGGDAAALDAFLALGAEAVARGVIGGGAPRSFLEHALTVVAPEGLAAVPVGRRVAALARLWNVGEGLAKEPPWLDAFVLAQAGRWHDPATAADFVAEALAPALAPPAPSRWAAPFRPSIVDARALDDDFLPGPLHLAAPAVVAVRDRRRPVHLALLLRPGGASQLMGPVGALPAWDPPAGLPPVRGAERVVRIGGADVPLPAVHASESLVAAPGGFVVVAAVDSQRLWVLEAAS